VGAANTGTGDDARMTAETCPSIPSSTATPDTAEMVKLCGHSQQQQQQQQPQQYQQQQSSVQNICINDDTYNQQYFYKPEYAAMEAWLDEHQQFTHDYFIRYVI